MTEYSSITPTLDPYPSDYEFPSLHNIFSMPQIRRRSLHYTDQVYVDTYANRKVRKAFRNQLIDILSAENGYIKKQLRASDEAKGVRKNKRKRQLSSSISTEDDEKEGSKKKHITGARRPPTAYTKFCEQLRQTRPHHEIVGQIQRLWKEHLNEPIKQRKVEQYDSKEQTSIAETIDSTLQPALVKQEEEEDIVFNSITQYNPHVRYESDSSSSEDEED